MSARVLVCGSRHWTDRETIREWLSKLPRGTTIAHGACRGADAIAGDVAKDLGFTVVEYHADWGRHGKAAGPIRNEEMVVEFMPQRALAFTEALMHYQRPTGTSDCVMRLLAHGVPVTIVPAKRLEVGSLTRMVTP